MPESGAAYSVSRFLARILSLYPQRSTKHPDPAPALHFKPEILHPLHPTYTYPSLSETGYYSASFRFTSIATRRLALHLQASPTMAVLAPLLAALISVLHVYFMILEMFLWATPRGRKVFKLTPEYAEQTKVLAANQGLYNGFLSAGLFWSLIHPVPEFAAQIQLFFLGCVVVAGTYGGLTVGRKILFIQAIPAAVSIVVVCLGI